MKLKCPACDLETTHFRVSWPRFNQSLAATYCGHCGIIYDYTLNVLYLGKNQRRWIFEKYKKYQERVGKS